MSSIKNYKTDNNSIEFELNNEKGEYKLSYTNALRRILISHLECYTINCDDTRFIENNSIFNNEFLKSRLCLIPIVSNKKNVNYDQLLISCNVRNETEKIKSVYAHDFTIKNFTTGEEYDIKDFIIYDELLFTKLQSDQYVHFECHLKLSDAFKGGSSHSTVSSCIVTFKNSNESNEKELINKERDYDINKFGQPLTYIFSYENIGFYDSDELIHRAISVVQEKLIQMKDKFNDYEYKNDYYYFNIHNENETLGNLVSSYLLDQKSITYCGYVIEHPLKHITIIKVKTDLKKNELFKTIYDTIDMLIKNYSQLDKQFK